MKRVKRVKQFARIRSLANGGSLDSDYVGDDAEFAGACRDYVAERYVIEKGVPVDLARVALSAASLRKSIFTQQHS